MKYKKIEDFRFTAARLIAENTNSFIPIWKVIIDLEETIIDMQGELDYLKQEIETLKKGKEPCGQSHCY